MKSSFKVGDIVQSVGHGLWDNCPMIVNEIGRYVYCTHPIEGAGGFAAHRLIKHPLLTKNDKKYVKLLKLRGIDVSN